MCWPPMRQRPHLKIDIHKALLFTTLKSKVWPFDTVLWVVGLQKTLASLVLLR